MTANETDAEIRKVQNRLATVLAELLHVQRRCDALALLLDALDERVRALEEAK